MRRLTPGEQALAEGMFGDAIDYARVRIAPRLPGRTAVTVGSTINFPKDAPADFASEPPRLQAWLIHELTHVWQFQTGPGRTVLSWARVAASGGYGPRRRGYDYAPSFAWGRLNLEQQASVVEHAFLICVGAAAPDPRLTLADYADRTPFERIAQTLQA